MNSPESGGNSPVAKFYEDAEKQSESVEDLMKRGGSLALSITNMASRLASNEVIQQDEVNTTKSLVEEILPKLQEARAQQSDNEKIVLLDEQIEQFEAFKIWYQTWERKNSR